MFSLSATDTVEKERGNQCKQYINPTIQCQAPPQKYIVPLAYSEISYGSRELSALSRINSHCKEEKYRKRNGVNFRNTYKNIQQPNSKSDVHPLNWLQYCSLSSMWPLELLTCTNKGWVKFKVIQRDMKGVQGHSSQLPGIFHTIRERFNNTISVNLSNSKTYFKITIKLWF